MSHAPHESLRGYSPNQILVDSCAACEDRCMSRSLGIADLDDEGFAKAWLRAFQWERGQLDDRVSNCEAPMLSVLWSVQVALSKRGVPLTGRVPDAWDVAAEPAL